MWNSFRLFLGDVIKNWKSWISFIFFLISFYGFFINPLLPEEYQKKYYMPPWIMFLCALVFIAFAGVNAYHRLRMERLEEFYKFSPEAYKDKIFRIFYNLYQEGIFLKDANTERRQKWDEETLKLLKKYCEKEFENIYLLNTGRRNLDFTPLEDNNYDKALSILIHFIDKDFDTFIKT